MGIFFKEFCLRKLIEKSVKMGSRGDGEVVAYFSKKLIRNGQYVRNQNVMKAQGRHFKSMENI